MVVQRRSPRNLFLPLIAVLVALSCNIPGTETKSTASDPPVEKTSIPTAQIQVQPATAIASPQQPAGLPPVGESHRAQNPQIGLNFIRFYWSEGRNGGLNLTTPYVQPESIFADFKALNVQVYRQFVKADLLWDVVEPKDNQWNFTAADAVLTNLDFEPVVTLFRMQYASPTPPWASDPAYFQKTIGAEAEDYLRTVVQRYGPYVKYWELGNEMDHWRSADPGSKVNGKTGEEKLPAANPSDGYSPQEQGKFLAQAAQIIRQYDPDAVIVLPGIAGLDVYGMETWLAGVIESGGKDWFDIVNYHYYSSWMGFNIKRNALQDFLKAQGIDSKPVWMTETGVTSSPDLTIRTDYPNNPESQAADVFRRLIQSYGHGDALAIWHTYLSSGDQSSDNTWRLYGIRRENSQPQLAYYAFKLFANEIIPFHSVTVIADDPRAVNAYKVTTASGVEKYVAWGKGNFIVPPGISQMVMVVPPQDGNYVWQATQPGAEILLSENPILFN